MRHRVTGRKLGRTASHRKATLAALCTSLIKHKRIQTTFAKAKETQRVVEKIITTAKKAYLEKSGNGKNVHMRREAGKSIKDAKVIQELFNEIAPKVAERNGGYTRVIKLGHRPGDSAKMAIIELVDYSDALLKKKKKEEKPSEKGEVEAESQVNKEGAKEKGDLKPDEPTGQKEAAEPEKPKASEKPKTTSKKKGKKEEQENPKKK